MKTINNFGKSLMASALTLGIAAGMATSANAQVQTDPGFPFAKNRARLVVLLHGVTAKPAEDPAIKVGTSAHARHYWGFDFIKGLQGKTDELASIPGYSNNEVRMQVITPMANGAMRFKSTTREDWTPETTDTNAFDMAPICFPVNWNKSLPVGINTNQTLIKDYIRIMTKNKGADATMVMVNSRDGSKHLMPQVAETIEEIYASYTIAFGHLPEADQPQIYLVGHSFGGIVARAILANPTGGDLWGNKLTAIQRTKADFLRARVVLVQTLAAPHEGTIVKDPSRDVANYLMYNAYGPLYNILSNLNEWAEWIGEERTEAQLHADTRDLIKMALDGVSGTRDCLDDLTRMSEYNSGILNPSTARRTGSGPLVPIYTAGGRNPGGTHYDRNRALLGIGQTETSPIDVIDMFAKGSRSTKEAGGLNIIEGLFHIEGYGKEAKKPWGTATDPEGDRVAGPFAGVGPSVVRPIGLGWEPNKDRILDLVKRVLSGKPYVFGSSDQEWDNDGFNGWDSAHAYHLNASNYYRIYNRTLYGNMLPWDNDNHGSIMFNAANGLWIHNELIREAGPIVGPVGSRRSLWTANEVPAKPAKGIKLEILELKDMYNQLDLGGYDQADFKLRVRIGAVENSYNLPNNTQTVSTVPAMTITNFPSTIIPIRIDIIDRDDAINNDMGHMSPTVGNTSLFLYFDTRTGRIAGDVNGVAGETMSINPSWVSPIFWSTGAQVSSKIRITQIQ